jgi:membrane protein DedA with SNARE-associated domain
MLGSHAPLVAVIVALLAAGLGVPIPEDLSLLTGGYLVWSGSSPWYLVIPLCVVAIVAGDSALFALGWHFGPRITQHRFLRHRLTPARLERVERHFQKHGNKTILAARFASGARTLFFLAAGAMRMSYWRFLLLDGAAAIVSGTAWVLLGWRFGAQIDWVRRLVHRVEHIAVAVAILVLAVWFTSRFFRRRLAGPPSEAPPGSEAV